MNSIQARQNAAFSNAAVPIIQARHDLFGPFAMITNREPHRNGVDTFKSTRDRLIEMGTRMKAAPLVTMQLLKMVTIEALANARSCTRGYDNHNVHQHGLTFLNPGAGKSFPNDTIKKVLITGNHRVSEYASECGLINKARVMQYKGCFKNKTAHIKSRSKSRSVSGGPNNTNKGPAIIDGVDTTLNEADFMAQYRANLKTERQNIEKDLAPIDVFAIIKLLVNHDTAPFLDGVRVRELREELSLRSGIAIAIISEVSDWMRGLNSEGKYDVFAATWCKFADPVIKAEKYSGAVCDIPTITNNSAQIYATGTFNDLLLIAQASGSGVFSRTDVICAVQPTARWSIFRGQEPDPAIIENWGMYWTALRILSLFEHVPAIENILNSPNSSNSQKSETSSISFSSTSSTSTSHSTIRPFGTIDNFHVLIREHGIVFEINRKSPLQDALSQITNEETHEVDEGALEELMHRFEATWDNDANMWMVPAARCSAADYQAVAFHFERTTKNLWSIDDLCTIPRMSDNLLRSRFLRKVTNSCVFLQCMVHFDTIAALKSANDFYNFQENSMKQFLNIESDVIKLALEYQFHILETLSLINERYPLTGGVQPAAIDETSGMTRREKKQRKAELDQRAAERKHQQKCDTRFARIVSALITERNPEGGLMDTADLTSFFNNDKTITAANVMHAIRLLAKHKVIRSELPKSVKRLYVHDLNSTDSLKPFIDTVFSVSKELEGMALRSSPIQNAQMLFAEKYGHIAGQNINSQELADTRFDLLEENPKKAIYYEMKAEFRKELNTPITIGCIKNDYGLKMKSGKNEWTIVSSHTHYNVLQTTKTRKIPSMRTKKRDRTQIEQESDQSINLPAPKKMKPNENSNIDDQKMEKE